MTEYMAMADMAKDHHSFFSLRLSFKFFWTSVHGTRTGARTAAIFHHISASPFTKCVHSMERKEFNRKKSERQKKRIANMTG